VLVLIALLSLNAGFLERAQCYFGGGTRIVMALDEYRESDDMDFLCSSRDGYRALRSSVTNESLGELATGEVRLAREVISDRYGIRTFLAIDGDKVKFEIVNEARIDLSGADGGQLHVPCLDQESCFAEKFLANEDRWHDESVLSRDAIDLGFMIEGWRAAPALEGLDAARAAYGEAVVRSAECAARKLLESKDYFKKCVTSLRVEDTGILLKGLKRLSAIGSWGGAPGRGRRRS
jgi:hypothetical protein